MSGKNNLGSIDDDNYFAVLDNFGLLRQVKGTNKTGGVKGTNKTDEVDIDALYEEYFPEDMQGKNNDANILKKPIKMSVEELKKLLNDQTPPKNCSCPRCGASK